MRSKNSCNHILTSIAFSIFIIGMAYGIGLITPMSSLAQNIQEEVTRTIDATEHFRPFPDLVGFRNTSLQKAPPPVLGEVSAKKYGRAQITRLWLNLDEMWDYRNRQFTFNFRIGVDKYKGVEEKHRETWDWELESDVHFYDYMRAFSTHSEDLMLTIRRYERDIMDGDLPVSMEDWKMIFKRGLKHYKALFSNIRYVEVGNEYALDSFMGATDKQYYEFYKLGYQAVNEVNKELDLKGEQRILVGGPVVTGSIIKKMGQFFELYSQDKSPEKRLDFVSWHEYEKSILNTVRREKKIKKMLSNSGIPENMPMFITEHNPHHGEYGGDDYLKTHMTNAAELVKTLYFSSIYSPTVKIFPWVQYHDSNIQTRFMWFNGPNEPDTKAEELQMLPIGASMKFLSMHEGGREIKIENSVDKKDLVLASVQNDRLVVQAINYGPERAVNINVQNLKKIFPGRGNGPLEIHKYLIDSNHSNHLANPDYTGGIERVNNQKLNNKEATQLTHNKLEANGIVLWEIMIGKNSR